MTVSDQFSALADKARGAVERSFEVWTEGVKSMTDHAGWPSGMPHVNASDAVDQYFDFVQQMTDFGRQYAHRVVSAVSGLGAYH